MSGVTFVSIAGAVLAIAAVILLVVTGSKISDSIVATSAIVALLGAFGSIRSGRNIARQELTYSYVARYNSPDLLAHWGRLNSFWKLDEPAGSLNNVRWTELTEAERIDIYRSWLSVDAREREKQKWGQWQAMEPSERADMLVFMNFMEELAGAYNLGLLDPRSVEKHLAFGARSRYNRGEWWIERLRDQRGDRGLLREWELMIEDLRYVSERSPAAVFAERSWQQVRSFIGL